MQYNLAEDEELRAAADMLAEFGSRGKLVELKVVNAKRTNKQNAYLHVLLGALGNYLGYNLEEMKTEYKRTICPSIYIYENNGKLFTRKSSKLSKEEMSASIDKLRTFAEEQGYPLPAESDITWIRNLERELEKINYNLR